MKLLSNPTVQAALVAVVVVALKALATWINSKLVTRRRLMSIGATSSQ